MNQGDKTHWGIIAVASLAGLVAATHVGKLPPAMPAVRADLGLGLVAGGWVASIFSLTGFLLGLVAGSFADRLGRGRMLNAGLGVLAAGSLLGGAADSGADLLVARFVEGIGFTWVIVTGGALIAQAAGPKDRKLALALWGMNFPTGMAGMVLIAPLLLEAQGWRWMWFFLGGTTAVTLLVSLLALRASTRGTARDRGGAETLLRNIRLTLALPAPWLISAAFGFYVVMMSQYIWLPTFLIEERGMAIFPAAALTALAYALNMVGNFIGGRLLMRGGSIWGLIAFSAAFMAAAALGIFSPDLPDAVRFPLCMGFAFIGGFLPAAVFSGTILFAPSTAQIGTLNGLIVTGISLGLFVGAPAIAAAVVAAGAWEGALWPVLACAVAVAGLAVALRGVERRLSPS